MGSGYPGLSWSGLFCTPYIVFCKSIYMSHYMEATFFEWLPWEWSNIKMTQLTREGQSYRYFPKLGSPTWCHVCHRACSIFFGACQMFLGSGHGSVELLVSKASNWSLEIWLVMQIFWYFALQQLLSHHKDLHCVNERSQIVAGSTSWCSHIVLLCPPFLYQNSKDAHCLKKVGDPSLKELAPC